MVVQQVLPDLTGGLSRRGRCHRQSLRLAVTVAIDSQWMPGGYGGAPCLDLVAYGWAERQGEGRTMVGDEPLAVVVLIRCLRHRDPL
jgi:hypothetical protein